MQTNLADWIKGTPEGDEAEAILRKCVHCGFCTATCPTYQLLGDELDGPRGRIYLIKSVLEGSEVTAKTQLHLDRCLTCRACESTCPSGVQYGRLADIGRHLVAERVPRPPWQRLRRAALAAVLPRPMLFGPLLALGRLLRPLLPRVLAGKIPAASGSRSDWPEAGGGITTTRHARRMLVLAGCVQPSLSPEVNAAAARLLDRIGISLVEAASAGCCGALRFHLDYQADGLDDMRALIDAWWPQVERGEIEAIVMTASGCGTMVKEYGHLLRNDAQYRDKAARISAITRDLAEVLDAELPALQKLVAKQQRPGTPGRIAFHPPCSLQHGQRIKGVAERVLAACGYELAPVPDVHLCCGSAGTYSILQPELAGQLRDNKLHALASGDPQQILTANIGCQTHLAAGAAVPVRHWVVALEERISG